MTMGQRIAEERKKLGISQEMLGEKMGVSRQAISKWESDGAVPDVDKLIALSKLFHVTVGWLLGVEEEPGGTDEEGFTEAQLKMIEEIVKRYQPKIPAAPGKPKRLGLKIAGIAAISLLAICVLSDINQRLDRDSSYISGLNGSYASIQSQLGLLADRLDALAEGEKLLADDTYTAIAWDDRTGADVTFSAVPKNWKDGDRAFISVRLSGQEVHDFDCQWDGTVCTAQLSLEAKNGYEFYYVVVHSDGSRDQQIMKNTGLEDMTDGLELYCYVRIGNEEIGNKRLRFNGVNFSVNAPKIRKAGEVLMLKSMDWVLKINGEIYHREPLLEHTEIAEYDNISGNVSGYTDFSLPGMEEGDRLELYLSVELSDGTQRLVPALEYQLKDEQWIKTVYPDE